jgi:Fe-S-cluster containining protein
VRFKYTKNLVFACNNCGICCGNTKQKTRHILLTEKDAQNITNYINQLTSTFANKITSKAPYVFEMKKNAETGKCLFHQTNQCSIYAFRPLICRFYPFELTTDQTGTHIFTETSECPQVYCHPENSKKILRQTYFKRLLKQAEEEIGPT